jgi:hypothetical protein
MVPGGDAAQLWYLVRVVVSMFLAGNLKKPLGVP